MTATTEPFQPDPRYARVSAAAIRKGDVIFYAGADVRVVGVHHGTPVDGKISLDLEGVTEPVTVGATRPLALKRLTSE